MSHMEVGLWLPGTEGGDITWEMQKRNFGVHWDVLHFTWGGGYICVCAC